MVGFVRSGHTFDLEFPLCVRSFDYIELIILAGVSRQLRTVEETIFALFADIMP